MSTNCDYSTTGSRSTNFTMTSEEQVERSTHRVLGGYKASWKNHNASESTREVLESRSEYQPGGVQEIGIDRGHKRTDAGN
ncbi:hypothetical protein PM082_002513 [Marasmius tenuissimus]|nr:hypothetical protein PM082_002513 [Marasmius tenuissimus]